jgi:hypothetical protein
MRRRLPRRSRAYSEAPSLAIDGLLTFALVHKQPIDPPWFTIANTLIGIVIFYIFGALALHYSGAWSAKFLPMSESATYDNTGASYNVTRIFTPLYLTPTPSLRTSTSLMQTSQTTSHLCFLTALEARPASLHGASLLQNLLSTLAAPDLRWSSLYSSCNSTQLSLLGVIGSISQKVIRQRYFGWWSRLNYLTCSGLDLGLTGSTLFVFFAVTVNNVVAPKWWGNTITTATSGRSGHGGPGGCCRRPAFWTYSTVRFNLCLIIRCGGGVCPRRIVLLSGPFGRCRFLFLFSCNCKITLVVE